MSRPALAVALLAVVVLAGCAGGGGGDTPMSDEATQLQNESVAAMQDVETYRAEMHVEASAENDAISMDIAGLFDRPARRAEIDVRVSTGDEVTMYLVDDTAYINVGGRWSTRNVSDRNLWDQNSQLQRQQELLVASDLEITGNETVDGVPVHVVEVNVPQDKLDELTSMAQQGAGSGTAGSISDATYTAYVAKDSKLMRKITLDMTVESDGQTVDTSVSMRFFDFGTDDAITVPEEAREESGAKAALAGTPAPAPHQ